MDVVISYARENRAILDWLIETLAAWQVPHWCDREIVSGDYRQQIFDAISGCKVMLLIWTRNTAESKECAKEVRWALHEEKQIIPLRFDQSRFSSLFAQIVDYEAIHYHEANRIAMHRRLFALLEKAQVTGFRFAVPRRFPWEVSPIQRSVDVKRVLDMGLRFLHRFGRYCNISQFKTLNDDLQRIRRLERNGQSDEAMKVASKLLVFAYNMRSPASLFFVADLLQRSPTVAYSATRTMLLFSLGCAIVAHQRRELPRFRKALATLRRRIAQAIPLWKEEVKAFLTMDSYTSTIKEYVRWFERLPMEQFYRPTLLHSERRIIEYLNKFDAYLRL